MLGAHFQASNIQKHTRKAHTACPLCLPPAGIAFHHAGLTTEERQGVERGYRSGCLQVCGRHLVAATSPPLQALGRNAPGRLAFLVHL